MTRPLLAIDAPSLYFRAFHGVPTSAATAPDGTPVNAVRGFCDMLATLIRTRGPDRLVCAMDADWRPAWRVELLNSYKAHRVVTGGGEQVPEQLVAQVPIIVDLLTAWGVPTIAVAGYEADDVLGTLAATAPAPVEIVSGDRDLFQLVDDTARVRLLYCGRGVARLEVADEAMVHAKFGVPAAAYVDFAVLRGDPSDGLPGVAGVGDKTAARLVTKYGDLNQLTAALSDPQAGFAPGLRAKLLAASDYLQVAPQVVKVAQNVPLPQVDMQLPAAPRDNQAWQQLAQRWNLTGACQRLLAATAKVL